MSATQVFFAGRYRYRRAAVLFGALLALGFGIGGIVAIGLIRRSQMAAASGGAKAAAIAVLVIGVLLAVVGLRLLILWFKGRTLILEITDVGVSYGKQRYDWPEVQWLGGRDDGGRRRQLHLKLRQKGTREIPMVIDQPLSVDRCDALMQELSASLQESHPHVAFG
jgi:hypothetical protein